MKYHVRQAFVIAVFVLGAITGRLMTNTASRFHPCDGLAKVTDDPRAADPHVTLHWTCRPSVNTPGAFEWHLEVR